MKQVPGRRPVRWLMAFIVVVAAYSVGLSVYKERLLEGTAAEAMKIVPSLHREMVENYQAGFRDQFERRFVPAVRVAMKGAPGLSRIRVLSDTGMVIFDTNREYDLKPVVFPNKDLVAKISEGETVRYAAGFSVYVMVPAGKYGMMYSFADSAVSTRIIILLVAGTLVFALLFLLARRLVSRMPLAARRFGLRPKFLLTILLINVITGAILFVTLSALQSREQTARIRKESALYGRFATTQIVSDFTVGFKEYYAGKFLPGIRAVISSNENLVGLRIFSRDPGAVVFDSESADMTHPRAPAPVRAALPLDVESELRGRDVVTRDAERQGEAMLKVFSAYRSERGDSPFVVEYTFSFHSLKGAVASIRKSILLDLLPAMAIGFLIAIAFAQLLISPIRRLAGALLRISAGDYDVRVDHPATDEIGELVGAFNGMADELRKKQELRKYLSDTTYRQVMEGTARRDGSVMGGSRVKAAVLFSDIKDFVSLCEGIEAEDVTALLNDHFAEMVEVVHRHGGEIDKFLGDALLAVFYADTEMPAEPSAAALRAVYCALEMREKLKESNAKRAASGLRPIETGVGISYGEVISGPIGSKDRKDFTVIGDIVNLASRIEKLSRQGRHSRIVFSNHVEEKVRGMVDCEIVGREPIRGKEEEVVVYELVRVRALGELVKLLEAGDVRQRLASMDVLGHSRNPEAVAHVAVCLADADERMRISAAMALARLAEAGAAGGFPDATSALFKQLESERSGKVVSALVSAAGRACIASGARERAMRLAKYLDSDDDRTVANTIEAIGAAGVPEVADLIIPKLSSRNNRVKANAAMALFAMGRVEVVDVLKPMLMHSDPLMRSSAAFATGELTQLARKDRLVQEWKRSPGGIKIFLAELQQSVPMLVSLLKDPVPAVKRQAVIALGKIKDKSAVLPIIDNIDFERDSGELMHDITEALRSIGSHKLVREVLQKF